MVDHQVHITLSSREGPSVGHASALSLCFQQAQDLEYEVRHRNSREHCGLCVPSEATMDLRSSVHLCPTRGCQHDRTGHTRAAVQMGLVMLVILLGAIDQTVYGLIRLTFDKPRLEIVP